MSVENQALYLISKVEEIEGREIIKIYESMGYIPQTIRNLLSKLKREKYITTPSRSVYSITNSGKEFVKNMYVKENFYDKTWDNNWYIVLIGIPEVYRKKRDTFRKSLVDLGFGLLYNSVYISPWDKIEAVMSLIDSLEIEEFVTILTTKNFIVNKIGSAGSAKINYPSNIWNLDEINLNYKKKFEYYKKEIEPSINKLIQQDNIDALQIFIHYLEVSDLIHELLEKDPMLPPEFLPPSWIGTNVLSTLYKIVGKLKPLIPKESIYSRFI
ncbi:PaaX family transcriptional regulator C-terminal domain-containing protein [Fredinandcohnia humi]